MFVKGETQPPELNFVVLNFVALTTALATPHSPSSENLTVTITKATETEIPYSRKLWGGF